MDFFGMGFGELVLILIIALIVFGPGRLPEVARTLGRISRNLKKMSSDLTTAVTKEIGLEEERQNLKKVSSDLTTAMTKPIVLNEEPRSHLSPDRSQKETPPTSAMQSQFNKQVDPPIVSSPEDHD